MNIKVRINILPKTSVKVFFPNKTVDVICFAKKYFGCIYRLICRRYGNLELLEQIDLEFEVNGCLYFLQIFKDSFKLSNNNSVLYNSKTKIEKKHVA